MVTIEDQLDWETRARLGSHGQRKARAKREHLAQLDAERKARARKPKALTMKEVALLVRAQRR